MKCQNSFIRRGFFLCRCGSATAFLLLATVSLIFIAFDTEPLFQRAASIAILGLAPAITIWFCVFATVGVLKAITWISETKFSPSGAKGKL